MSWRRRLPAPPSSLGRRRPIGNRPLHLAGTGSCPSGAAAMQQTLTVGAELLVSLISAGAAIASALVAAFLSARASARQSQLQAEIEQQQALRRKLEERAAVMTKGRDPLLWAAFDLQSRVYNIVTRQFLSVYQQSG